MVRLGTLASALLLAACGGLDNRPLETGGVSGTISNCDAEGVVGLVGDATVRTVPDGTCHFRLTGLEPGAHELFVAPTRKKVALVPVQVVATQVTDVGEVVGRPGAFAHVQVSSAGVVDYAGMVSAPELPIEMTPLGKSGQARIGPFPSGCFRLEVTVNGVGQKALTSCLAEGEEQELDVAF